MSKLVEYDSSIETVQDENIKTIINGYKNPFIRYFKNTMKNLMDINMEKHNPNIGYIDRRKTNFMYYNKYINKTCAYVGYINHVIKTDYKEEIKKNNLQDNIINNYLDTNDKHDDYVFIEKNNNDKKKKSILNLYGLI